MVVSELSFPIFASTQFLTTSTSSSLQVEADLKESKYPFFK